MRHLSLTAALALSAATLTAAEAPIAVAIKGARLVTVSGITIPSRIIRLSFCTKIGPPSFR